MSIPIKWQERSGPEGDVVVSTRIRLARNLNKLPFPARMNQEQAHIVVQAARRAMEHSENLATGLRYVDLEDLTKTQAVSMVERHLVSPEFIRTVEGRALFLTPDETVSVMVNEEDHLRLQAMEAGLNLQRAYQILNVLDDALNTSLQFAYDEKLGYLTQCPTNLGTGMRASVMLHLPALEQSGQLRRIAQNLQKLGLTLRGAYGENSEAVGSLYQLSNQVTLGLSEEEAIQNLEQLTRQLIEKERESRATLLTDLRVVDKLTRSLGILQTATLLTGKECSTYLSHIRLLLSGGYVQNLTYEEIHTLFLQSRPATLSLRHGGTLPPEERDRDRATFLRKALQDVHLHFPLEETAKQEES